MSEELARRYTEKIQATYMANMAFFSEKMPHLYRAVTEGEAGVRIDATVDENAVISFALDGNPLPLETLLDQAREAMASFESVDRPTIEVRTRDSLPDVAPTHVDLEGYINDYYFSYHDFSARFEIDTDFVKRCGRAGATHLPDFGDRHLPIVIVFGSGYGSHLVELLDRYTIRHLFVVDNDPAISRLSFGFTDYIALYNNHLMRGVRFTMISARDPELIVNEIASALQAYWPPFFTHGISIFRNLRNIEVCQKVEQTISDQLWLTYRGWGFFDDELMSLKHSIANLCARRPVFTLKKPVSEKAVVFVVANGPSLDSLTDILREYKDRAIIISCGSALSALARLGIVPDFHVEVERPYWSAESISASAPPEFLAQVRLVTPNVAHPEVFSKVKEGYYFLKMGDTVEPTFPEKYLRVTSFPTVSNGALSWMLRLGVKQAYLFGVDLGARDASRHHSSHSMYFHREELPESFAPVIDVGAAASAEMGVKVEANFGGVVVSNDILTLARISMETECSKHLKDAKIFNLNDGALIKGTTALKPEDFRFPEDAPEKSVMLAEILANTEVPEDFGSEQCRDIVLNAFEGMLEDVKPIIRTKVADKMALFEKLAMVHRTVNESLTTRPAAYWSLRGSILHMQRRIYEYATFIPDEAEAVAFSDQAYATIERFLDTAIDEVRSVDVVNGTVPLVPAQTRKPAAPEAAKAEAKEEIDSPA